MASRPIVLCPICNDEIRPDRKLEAHLVDTHSKAQLAKYVVAEEEFLDNGEASE